MDVLSCWILLGKPAEFITSNGKWLPDFIERLKASAWHQLYLPLLPFTHTIRYDTIGEFNVDWKAEYSALSSTRSQKKKLKQPTPVPL